MDEYKDEITFSLLGTMIITSCLYGYLATPSDTTVLLICVSVGIYLLAIAGEKLWEKAKRNKKKV